MNSHSLAHTTRRSRLEIVQRLAGGWSVEDVAEAFGTSLKTIRKWRDRHADGGIAALTDRSSRPHSSPTRVPNDWRDLVLELRKYRLTAKQLAAFVEIPRSTIARVLGEAGVGQLKWLEPAEPIRRYQKRKPGSLLHLDVKKLGRFERAGHRVTGDRRVRARGSAGWEYVHVAIDDASRVAYAEVLADETASTTTGFLERALRWFAQKGVVVRRILTDNAFNYTKSTSFAALCKANRIKHRTTRPYRPRTNGKAERFIQTLLREWAYVRAYGTSEERVAALGSFLAFYNRSRPHQGIKGMTPLARLKAALGTTS